jgi:hypothetical protein
VEGPIEEYNLPKFRWAVGPVTSVELEARQSGTHLFAIYYRCVHPGQVVKIDIDGSPAGTFRLAYTGMNEGRLLSFRGELRLGINTVNLHYEKWAPPESNPRPIALLITKIVWFSTAKAAAGVS